MSDDATLTRILRDARCIALVGISANADRPSNHVAAYLAGRGYRVIGVNPGLAGKEMFGETIRATLADCPPEVDMVDVFRASDAVPAIATEAIAHLPNLRTIWLQIGVTSDEARQMAAARGLDFVENRCPRIEFPRLLGDARIG